MESNGGVHTAGGGGNDNDIISYIYISFLPLTLLSPNGSTTHSMMTSLPLPFLPPSVWTPPFDSTQPIHKGNKIKLPLPLPSLSVNEPLSRISVIFPKPCNNIFWGKLPSHAPHAYVHTVCMRTSITPTTPKFFLPVPGRFLQFTSCATLRPSVSQHNSISLHILF